MRAETPDPCPQKMLTRICPPRSVKGRGSWTFKSSPFPRLPALPALGAAVSRDQHQPEQHLPHPPGTGWIGGSGRADSAQVLGGLCSPGAGQSLPQMIGCHQSALSKGGKGCLTLHHNSDTFTWFGLDQPPLGRGHTSPLSPRWSSCKDFPSLTS